MSSSDDTAVAQALSTTDAVLLHIFQHLGIKDQLDCRLVNQKWHAAASEALHSHHLYINPAKLRCPEGSFKDDIQQSVMEQAYSENRRFLAERICKNSNFRFLGFVYDPSPVGPGVQVQEVCLEFAKSCGKHLRRLKILGGTSANLLREMLACFREIEHLSVGFVEKIAKPKGENDDDGKYLKLNGKNISFPKLQTLKLIAPHSLEYLEDTCGTQQLIQEVISSAPKLSRIEDFDVSFTEAVLKCGKLNTITELSLHFLVGIRENHLPYLKKFSEHSPSLRSLSCIGFYLWVHSDQRTNDEDELKRRESVDSTLGSVDRILRASKDTLKHLQIDYLEKPYKFTKLTSLHIVDRSSSDDSKPYRIFPRDWEYAPRFYFPVLHTVRLGLKNCGGDSVKTYFGEFQDDKFPRVTTLEIGCPFDEFGVEALGATFPNVKTLRVFWQDCPDSCLADLWVFSPTLQTLEILDVAVDSEDFEELDASITGFYADISGKLRKRPKIFFDADDLEAFRNYPSITQLSGLGKLSIHFICEDPKEVTVPESSTVSPIFQWYAFDLMPNMKTEFLYDFKGKHADVISQALEPYKPYVTILPR